MRLTTFKPGYSLALIVVGLAVFLQCYEFGYITYDDPLYITENPIVRRGISWNSIVESFSYVGESNLWHPITYISHSLDVSLFGLENPSGAHCLNVFLHVAAAVLLYQLFLKIGVTNKWAFLVALLWLVHPLRVQSVAWLSERKDLLSGCFFLLSLAYWLNYLVKKKNSQIYYLLSLLLYICACMSKPSVLGLPFLLIVFWIHAPRRKELNSYKKLLIAVIPFVLVSLSIGYATLHMHSQGGLTADSNFYQRLQVMPVSFIYYIRETFLPVDNRFWVYLPASSKLPYISLLCFVSIAILGGLVLKFCSHSRLMMVGLCWYILLWFPVSGLVQFGPYFVADRYSYLSQVGLFMMLIGFFQDVYTCGNKKYLAVLTALIVTTCAGLTMYELKFWHSSEELFEREVKINSRSLLAPIHLGIEKMKKGENDEALRLFELAITIDARSGLAYSNAGVAAEALNKLDTAEIYYKKAIDGLLHNPTPYFRLANLKEKNGMFVSAGALYKEATTRFPHSSKAFCFLGYYELRTKKDTRDALKYFNNSLKLDSENSLARKGLDIISANQKKIR